VTQTLSISRLANVGAEVIFSAFESYRERFAEITCRAQARFEGREWLAMRGDAAERLDLYRQVVDRTLGELHNLLGERGSQKLLWVSMKAVYSGLIARCQQWELAETFFNSITRRIFTTVGVDSEIEFVDSDFEGPPTPTLEPITRAYGAPESLAGLISRILAEGPFHAPYQDLARDAGLAAGRIAEHFGSDEADAARAVEGAEIITSVFYRGSAAYLVGRLFWKSHALPR
jgi:isocitrate dehydrogenase kinase/phosphatase